MRLQLLFADKVPYRRGMSGWRVWGGAMGKASAREVAEMAGYLRQGWRCLPEAKRLTPLVLADYYSSVEGARAVLVRELRAFRQALVARQARELAEVDAQLARAEGAVHAP